MGRVNAMLGRGMPRGNVCPCRRGGSDIVMHALYPPTPNPDPGCAMYAPAVGVSEGSSCTVRLAIGL